MNRHVFDTVSLIFGVSFLAVTGIWLLNRWVAVELPSLGWIAASGLVLLGVLGLITTMLQRRGGAWDR